MAIELPEEARKLAIASIERYFQANMEDEIGNVAAAGVLDAEVPGATPPGQCPRSRAPELNVFILLCRSGGAGT